MAWTDIFPFLSEEMLDDYEASVSKADKAELDDFFHIDEIHNPQPDKPHAVSTCLFWKDGYTTNPDLPAPSKDRLIHAARYGLIKRVNPWFSYTEPLLYAAPAAAQNHPDTAFIVYLARDMDFLVPDLVDVGWEVRLMAHSSVRHSPGMMWRFLTLEDEGRLVTCIDADRIPDVESELARTRLMHESGLGCWRIPGYYNQRPDAREITYRPILGGHFGARGGQPVSQLAKAFIWHVQQEKMPLHAELPGCIPMPLHATTWPEYGFDEWFLMTALYPRLAFEGILTFMPTDAQSLIMPIDIEYATWANTDAEIVPFNVGGCC